MGKTSVGPCFQGLQRFSLIFTVKVKIIYYNIVLAKTKILKIKEYNFLCRIPYGERRCYLDEKTCLKK
jgi:hypothetical protein